MNRHLRSCKAEDRRTKHLECLNKALEYDPEFGDAYVLKSYLWLEVLPNIDEALAAGEIGSASMPPTILIRTTRLD